jgi:hypothetical protein
MRLTNDLVPVLRGPAVVQVRLDWAIRLDCNLARTPGGATTFTVFPDGRIVRYDTVFDPVSSPVLVPAPCACDSEADPRVVNQFTLAAFWTLAQQRFVQIYAPGARGFPDPTEVITNMSTSCIDGGAYQVAFGWREADGMTIHSGDTAITFGRDLVLDAQTLEDFSFKNRSAMFIVRTGCEAGVARAGEYAAPSCSADAPLACLAINGTGTVPADLDGIYGGDDGSGRPGVPVAMGPTELKGAIGGPFAVWLRFPGPVTALRATLEGAKGAWYLPQQVDDRSWIVWFADSISAGQTITLDPF